LKSDCLLFETSTSIKNLMIKANKMKGQEVNENEQKWKLHVVRSANKWSVSPVCQHSLQCSLHSIMPCSVMDIGIA
jgi:hypothetical protein